MLFGPPAPTDDQRALWRAMKRACREARVGFCRRCFVERTSVSAPCPGCDRAPGDAGVIGAWALRANVIALVNAMLGGIWILVASITGLFELLGAWAWLLFLAPIAPLIAMIAVLPSMRRVADETDAGCAVCHQPIVARAGSDRIDAATAEAVTERCSECGVRFAVGGLLPARERAVTLAGARVAIGAVAAILGASACAALVALGPLPLARTAVLQVSVARAGSPPTEVVRPGVDATLVVTRPVLAWHARVLPFPDVVIEADPTVGIDVHGIEPDRSMARVAATTARPIDLATLEGPARDRAIDAAIASSPFGRQLSESAPADARAFVHAAIDRLAVTADAREVLPDARAAFGARLVGVSVALVRPTTPRATPALAAMLGGGAAIGGVLGLAFARRFVPSLERLQRA